MACWLDQASSNTELCDAIDEIMKQEHEDIILDQSFSSGDPLDISLDRFPGNLEPNTPVSPLSSILSTTTNDYSSSNNIFDAPTKPYSIFPINNSQNNTAAGSYSALGISPQFTSLSIHSQRNPYPPPTQDNKHSMKFPPQFVPSSMAGNSKTILHPPPYSQQQNDTRVTGSYGFDLGVNLGESDVKRFRSASMNEGATYQQTRQGQQSLDPYRMRSSTYVEPSCYYSKGNSSTNTTVTTESSASSVSTDLSSTNTWPCANYTRPSSTSFSEVLDHQRNQQQQQQQQQIPGLSRMQNSLSASYEGSSPSYSLSLPTNQGTFSASGLTFQNQATPNCTLFSLNQPPPINGRQNSPTSPAAMSSVTRKTGPLTGFPVEEIKEENIHFDDSNSPAGHVEQQSETDLWSDIEPHSDQLQGIDEDDLTSDDETATTVSAGFKADLKSARVTSHHLNTSLPFWQYNVQAKGPKTKRILYLKERDPHLSREFSDPVYQLKLSQTRGQPLSKLRKGDGNDVTPNPMKLYQLGKQIRSLSTIVGKAGAPTASVYHGIYNFDAQPNPNDSAEVKKEKNKIASRACRLRKKAQHEANKLKLHGLNEEHKTLMELITSIKILILQRCQGDQLMCSSAPNESLEAACSQMIASKYNHGVAGNTDGFVQTIISDMEKLYASKTERSQSLNT